MGIRQEFQEARDFLLLHRTDYNFAYTHFKWPRMKNFNWALEYFDPMAEGNHQTALWIVDEHGEEEKYSFADLAQRSNQVANYLRRLGVRRGDHVMMILGNEVAQWECLLAVMKLGAVMVPSSPILSSEELEDRLDRGEIKALITTRYLAPRFNIRTSGFVKVATDGSVPDWNDYSEASRESADFDPQGVTRSVDPLLLYFTSGTTAKPKLVEHTHQSYPVGHLSTMYWIGVQPGDIHMNVSSAGWAKHIWSNFFAPWNAGATVFVLREMRFDPKKVLDAIEKYKVTTFCAPPTVWRMFLNEEISRYKMSLREAVSAGEPLEESLLRTFEAAWGVSIREGYGQTETTALLGQTPGHKVRAHVLGKPLPGFAMELLDADGRIVDEGEICVDISEKPMGIMSGYRDVEEDENHPFHHSFFHTHDLAKKDDQENYSFIGRSDDVFKCSDYRISPFELEAILLEHPAVREVAVIPSPDPQRLFVPKAIVFLAKGFEPTRDVALSIMTHSRVKLAPFKRIRRVEFGDLPKTSSGKIKRSELRLKEQKKIEREEKSPYEFWEEDFRATLQEIWTQDLP